MILLSRLIKSQYVRPQPHDEDRKVIRLQPLTIQTIKDESESHEIVISRLKAEAENLLANAKVQAEQIMTEAQVNLQETNNHIAQLRADWETEKEQLIQTVQTQAFEEGFQQGEKDATEQYAQTLLEARQIVDKAKTDYMEQVEQSEEVILKLGLKVAEKVLRVQLEERREDFLQIVKHAIKEVKDYADINIIVHPYMYELVLSQKDELRALFNRDKSLFIYADEELQETGCVIESSFGRIDASIDSQLGELKIKLLDLLEEE
jgi:flagellar assembly protein FliH